MVNGFKAIGLALLILFALAVCFAIGWIVAIVKMVMPVLFAAVVLGLVLYYYLANKCRKKVPSSK